MPPKPIDQKSNSKTTWWQAFCEPDQLLLSDGIMWILIFFFTIALTSGSLDKSKDKQQASIGSTKSGDVMTEK